MIDFTINYIIPSFNDQPEPEDFSFFQGFSSGIIKTTSFFEKILSDLPLSLLELYLDREKVIRMRVCGKFRYSITPIPISQLKIFPLRVISPFYCILSSEETFDETVKFIRESEYPILHISTVESASSVLLEEADVNHVLEHAAEVLKYVENKLPKTVILNYQKILSNAKVWKKEALNSNKKNHLITLANELILQSLNYEFSDEDLLVPGTNNDNYINALLSSAELVQRERNKALKANANQLLYPPCTTMILSLPSMYRDIYRRKINIRKFDEPYDLEKIAQTLKLLQQQKGYNLLSTSEDLKTLLPSPEFQTMIKERQEEIRTYSYAVSLKACNNFAPCLRLPPALNTLQGDLIQFANCDRTGSKNKVSKINRLYSALIKKMDDIVDKRFIELIEEFPYSVKIISDIPLEWIPVRDLPLMIRFNSSRISATPGNLFFHQAIDRRVLVLSPEDLTEVLVVRSFKKNDRLREILQTAINTFLEAFDDKNLEKDDLEKFQNNQTKTKNLDIKVRFVDISNEDDFVKALNDYNGQIMIFDGHGSHKKDTDIGSVVLEGMNYDVWNLKDKARIPPIVILSACDTHPIDASHASTANGFLAAGAMTVLASVLPLDARYTAMFIGRLILRLGMYVPTTVYDLNKPIRWNNIISGLQRMNYITESLRLLHGKGGLSLTKEVYLKISNHSNKLINSENPYWYEIILELIAKEFDKTLDEIKELIYNYAQFPESMKYIQMGNPEQILIVKQEILNLYKNLPDSI